MDTTELLSRLDNWRVYHGDVPTEQIIRESAKHIREQAEALTAMCCDGPIIRIPRKSPFVTLIIHD
jgi:hypothetical protein